jgi:hypothetical protein
MSVWFEGSSEIESDIQQVKDALENQGEHYVELVRLMPSLTSVELVEQGSDFVTIKTNEGLMKRTSIAKRIDANSVVVDYDEEYLGGKMVVVKSHVMDKFTTIDTGIQHRTVISGVEAPGFIGFFYRNFGSSNIGNALLRSYKAYFERKNQ